jgi:hypothetical protein
VTMLWLGGQKANAIETGAGVTASPSADSLFPTTALYDRHPDRVFKFGSLTSAPSLTFDLDMLGGTGSFETTSGFPVGWTVEVTGTGAVTQSTTHVSAGTYAAKLAGGSGTAAIYRDVTCRVGMTFKLSCWLYADATGIADVYVTDLLTGKYWTGSAWDATPQVWVQQATPGASSSSTVVTVDDFDTIQAAVTVIRVRFENPQAASEVWADAVEMLPGVNFCSVHGHNIDPRSAPTLRTSTDNFASSDDLRATFDLRQPAFYAYLGSQFKTTAGYIRYWRILFAGTNSTTSGAIYVGEVVLGEVLELRGPALPLQANYSDQQVQVPRRFGAPAIYGFGSHELRSYPLTIRCESTDDRDEFFNEWRRTIGGYPVVVVPHDGDGHADVVYGQLEDALPHSWATKRFVTLSTTINELPLPLVTG